MLLVGVLSSCDSENGFMRLWTFNLTKTTAKHLDAECHIFGIEKTYILWIVAGFCYSILRVGLQMFINLTTGDVGTSPIAGAALY
jgi:hypothetical protein